MLDMLLSLNELSCTGASVHIQRSSESNRDERPAIMLLLVKFLLVDKFLTFVQQVESQ